MNIHDSQIKETFYDELVADPSARFQKFFNFYCTVSIVPSFPIDRYLRSSKELIRMANVYFGENDYLHAFILYSRFIILFLEKIKTHPDYTTCDKAQLSPILKQCQTIAFPRAEKLKKYIKETFASQEIQYKNLQEQRKLSQGPSAPVPTPTPTPSSSKQLSPQELESLKLKYNIENENELRRMLDLMVDESEPEKSAKSQSNVTGAAVPVVDRGLKPKNNNEVNNYNLRSVYVPSDLTDKFLEAAWANTDKNIETCGFLAGKLENNKFIVSTLIIPKQTGTSDTCNTIHEHELFDTIDSLNLITLGWIHTHPSQTAFLSSIDLHTQFGFQIMVHEAIAIVCAPKFNENRTFILTPDYGVKTISECSQSGFHMHQNNPPIFEDCNHVKEDPRSRVNLIDLRFKIN